MGVTFGGKETKHKIASVPFAKGNVSKSGDTMSGNLDMGGHSIANAATVRGSYFEGVPGSNGGNVDLRTPGTGGGNVHIEWAGDGVRSGRTVYVGADGNVGLNVSGSITAGGEVKAPGLCNAPSFTKPRIAGGIVTLIADGCCASVGYLALPGPAVALDRVVPTATFLGDDYRGYTIETCVPDLYTVKLRVKGTNSGKVYAIAVYDAQ